jgi:hypothetical protein
MRERSLDKNRNRGDEHDGKNERRICKAFAQNLEIGHGLARSFRNEYLRDGADSNAMRTWDERAEWIEGSAPVYPYGGTTGRRSDYLGGMLEDQCDATRMLATSA